MNNFDLDDQLLDVLGLTEERTHMIPKNPINLIWLIENWDYSKHKDKQIIDTLLEKIKAKPIKDKTRKKIYQPHPVEGAFTPAKLIERIDFLITQGLDINNHIDRIISFKSTEIFAYAISKGLKLKADSLYNAIATRQTKIGDYAYSLPESDKNYINPRKNNTSHIAVRTRNYKILEDMALNLPQTLYVKNSEGKCVVDYLFGDKNYNSIKNKDSINKIMSFVLGQHHNSSYPLSEEQITKLYNNSQLKPFISEYNHDKLDREMPKKDKRDDTKKIVKI